MRSFLNPLPASIRSLRLVTLLVFSALLLAGSARAQVVVTEPLTVKDGTISTTLCNNGSTAIQVGLATYRVVVPTCVQGITQAQLNTQILFDSETANLEPKKCVTLTVKIPKCAQADSFFQADSFTGNLITNFPGSDYYAGRLLDGRLFFNGQIVECLTEEMIRQCICTFTQGGFQQLPRGNNVGQFLLDNFANTFLPQGVTIGSGGGNTQITFFSPGEIREFLLSTKGKPSALPAKSVFAAQVLTLSLNVGFNPGFGNLVLCGKDIQESLKNKTVSQVLALANIALGGGGTPTGLTIGDLNDLVTNLNEAFDGCSESNWAKMNLCVPTP